MSNCKQMTLIDHEDAASAATRIDSEQELARAAWAIAGGSGLSGLTGAESDLVTAALEVPSEDWDSLVTLIRQGGDPLGDAFVRLRSPRQRRSLGAVYTPAKIVDAMVEWIAANEQPARVVDPGAGSGRFILRAGRTFPDASLVAVELDPLAALVCRANLTAAGLDHRAQVIVDDYRQTDLGSCNGATAFVGNPPYVRHHQIEPHWKQWLTTTATARGFPVSGLAGLHIHFFLATLLAAQLGDVGAFVTSAEWNGRQLRAAAAHDAD